ncbi:hypothetical protein TALK_04130 [Thalassospira alkalitolerans]|uniref:Uncharacterized protein n=1 Tax=Thalassospira alkalitolerans TaxID=1293890 RepID=A0A1Y2LEM0_9PROT|nr:hypothetical protein TALK_04130 [Thalassospira alkalitolerans]
MNGHPMRLAAGTEPGLQAIWSYFYTRDTTKAMTQGHRLADGGQHFSALHYHQQGRSHHSREVGNL